jgi:hypothetical protein
METVKVVSLTGSSVSFQLNASDPIAYIYREVNKEHGDYRMFRLTYKGPLEDFGVWNPISVLPKENEIRICKVLNLEATGSVVLASMRETYRKILLEMLEKIFLNVNSDVSELDRQRLNARKTFDALWEMKKKARDTLPENLTDPYTHEVISNLQGKSTWLQDGKCFAMSYPSLKSHVKNNMYLDEFGIYQIKNPYTNTPIPDPWRADFIYEATGMIVN